MAYQSPSAFACRIATETRSLCLHTRSYASRSWHNTHWRTTPQPILFTRSFATISGVKQTFPLNTHNQSAATTFQPLHSSGPKGTDQLLDRRQLDRECDSDLLSGTVVLREAPKFPMPNTVERDLFQQLLTLASSKTSPKARHIDLFFQTVERVLLTHADEFNGSIIGACKRSKLTSGSAFKTDPSWTICRSFLFPTDALVWYNHTQSPRKHA